MAVDGFMTKTQRYRKVTKPLLERKRRARMNLYLDELKELIMDSMEADGENIAKLEKADILELTVNYLKSQRNAATHQNSPQTSSLHTEKFRAGYTQATYEVSQVFACLGPGLDLQFGMNLLKQLGLSAPTPPSSSASTASRAISDLQDKPTLRPEAVEQQVIESEDVWRPW